MANPRTGGVSSGGGGGGGSSQTITTIAGTSGVYGSADGTGTNATFNSPYDLTFASNGDMYVADTLSGSIRKVTPSGVVTTFASGFNSPYGLDIGPDGNFYVADTSNQSIHKVIPGGVVSTLAANLGYVMKVVFGPDGNIYAPVGVDSCILKVTLSGVVTTFAGSPGTRGHVDGTGTNALFLYPYDLGFASNGDMYVADRDASLIRKVTPSGVVTTFAGTPGIGAGYADGTGTNALFDSPFSLTFASNDDMYVADQNGSLIRKVTPSGVVTTFAGIYDSQAPAYGSFNAVGMYSDILYAASSGDIKKIIGEPSPTITSTITTTNYASTMTITQTTALVAGVPGVTSFTDGSARDGGVFAYPVGIAIGPDGNFYLADKGNNLIRKITPSGIVSVFVGQPGAGGSATGTGTNATFNGPTGVAFASNGDMYVCVDRMSYIAKVTPSGVVTIFAGTPGPPAYADGTGTDARFAGPQGLAVAPNGDVYVADSQNNCIRKITPDGVVTTFAGSLTAGYADGTGTDAQFLYPSGVAVASNGDIYVTDQINSSIRKITPSGVVTTLAGGSRGQDGYAAFGYADGTGTDATFGALVGLAIAPNGDIYLADQGNQSIRKVTPSGVVTTVAGGSRDQNGDAVYGYVNGTGTDAIFNAAQGLVVASNGDIYVSDTNNNVIRKVTSSGVVTKFAGSPGVAGYGDGDGNITRATFSSLANFVFTSNGDMYVADTGNNSIRKVTPSGVVTTFAGSGQGGHADGTGTNAQFTGPSGITIGLDGNFYVADTYNQVIRKVTPSGVVTTIAGTPDLAGYVDGTGTDAKFWNPNSISVASDGNMYVADNATHIIRKVTTSGVVTTLAGSFITDEYGSHLGGYIDGTGTNAQFYHPFALAVGPDGNIYVADSTNNRIRKIDSGLASLNMTGNSYFTNYITAGGSVNVNRDLDVSGNTDLRGALSLTKDQVILARTLFNCQLPNNINMEKLKKEKPGLFKKPN
jgi:streptogramin lyase